MPATRSMTTGVTRSSRPSRYGAYSRPSRYVTSTYDKLFAANVCNSMRASESDKAKYPRFDNLLQQWKSAIDQIHRLKHSDRLRCLKDIEFDENMTTKDRIQSICEHLGIDGTVFDLHICVTKSGKKICFCFACLYEGDSVQPRSYSLLNKNKNMERHPSSDSHCRVISKLFGLDWEVITKKIACPHADCKYAVNARRLDQYVKHMKRVHGDDEASTADAKALIDTSPAASSSSLRSSNSPLSSSASSSSVPTPLSLDSSSPLVTDDFDLFNPSAFPDNYGLNDPAYTLTQPLDYFSFSQTNNIGGYGQCSGYPNHQIPSLWPDNRFGAMHNPDDLAYPEYSFAPSYDSSLDWNSLPTDGLARELWPPSSAFPDLDGTMSGPSTSQILGFQPSMNLSYEPQAFDDTSRMA